MVTGGPYVNDDIVLACMDLVGRAGAKGFEIGYLHDDVPVDKAEWYAYASYNGARVKVEGHQSPVGAALALAQRLLAGATCRCRKQVSLSDDQPGCRWHLAGPRWEPGCDAKPVTMPAGMRGNLGAMNAAIAQPSNRAERRRQNRRG